MRLSDCIADFITRAKHQKLSGNTSADKSIHALELFNSYCSAVSANDSNNISSALVRDFARWYIEETGDSEHSPLEPQTLLDSLADFLRQAGEQTDIKIAQECRPVISELNESLPRAIEITRAFADYLSEHRGAFSFPEFLTSFEEGGHSQYDIGPGGEAAALEGYFRIARVEANLIEAEDLITEERVWPVNVPDEVARLLRPDYIINLEIIRTRQGWEVAGGGFAYPPRTAII